MINMTVAMANKITIRLFRKAKFGVGAVWTNQLMEIPSCQCLPWVGSSPSLWSWIGFTHDLNTLLVKHNDARLS